MKESLGKAENTMSRFSKADFWLYLFLIPLYFAVWGKFGQKFAAGAVISMATGVFCWFVALVLCSSPENEEFSEKTFAWPLFALFPLFCPLGLPLWLIPFILIISYLVAISCFGGYGRHFFNPVALAVVFMVCGYSNTASLSATRPLPPTNSGYKTWSAGMPSAKPLWRIYESVSSARLVEASVSGALPAIPGHVFGLPLLLASFFMSFVFAHRRLWWLAAVSGTALFAFVCSKYSIMVISPAHPLLLGIVPGLLLIAIADFSTLPESPLEQVLGGLIFAALALLFIVKSDNVLGPVFAFLLAQVLLPLLADLTKKWSHK
ncbi:MAG: RnfABCDGE type electron transport complex subunit D [Candidatus Riflebacteria bacterium]|nr:RnfABCDGE type electron transport complex subunit D [Candidatus Riflebacteria bacterium]